MPRRLRFIPERGTLVEVTCRVIHGRMLLTPSRPLNDMIVGALARGKRRYGVRICAAAFLSNHAHLLLEVDDSKQLADFMRFVSSKIAREAGRRFGWSEKFWGRRYSSIVVSDEPAAQIARLRYVLAHGVKENLVSRCVDWPGVHAAEALMTGRALVGCWLDRTAAYRARLRGKKGRANAYKTREVLTFDPLPCWRHFDAEAYQKHVADLVASIEADAKAARRARSVEPCGVEAIRRQKATQHPRRAKRSPAPVFHAATRRARHALLEAYRWFEAVYRDAARRWRAGDRRVSFPAGSFPPLPPFVCGADGA